MTDQEQTERGASTVEELAEAWHAPDCTVDAGGACVLHGDWKEAWVAGYQSGQLSEPGGSGAGSTVVTLDLSEFAQHVVTSEWLAEVKAKFTKLQMDLAQSRATEAELRARVERLTAWVRSRTKADALSDEQIGKDVDQWYIGLPAALDAAEQPARAEGGQG